MTANVNKIASELWKSADQLRANSALKSSEYSAPVLGLIFLRYADQRFKLVDKEREGRRTRGKKAEENSKDFYRERGALVLPPEAQYDYLLGLTGDDELGAKLSKAMDAIEKANPELDGVLPKADYKKIENETLDELLRLFHGIDVDTKGDVLGDIYQYFMGEFARSEGQGGGEFFTPVSVVRVIVYVLEPSKGNIFDLASGAGGMFVESGRFVKEELGLEPKDAIVFYGQEKVEGNVNLCKMNLGVHGLLWVSNIALENTYYEDIHNCVSKADFLMANPPFNVDEVDKERIKNNKRRFPFGMPRGNGNYLWIQLFYSALNETGRAGFVMANSAGDAELEIRQQLIKTGVVDVMIAVSSNMFYTVTLPCTLWFFDKGKVRTPRKDKVLFIDARNLYRQISRKLREFKSGCIEKEVIAERFPALKRVEGLLVESPIDDDFWDWNEELQQAEQVKALIEPVVKPKQEEAGKLVSALYAPDVYENVAKPLLGTPLLGNEPENVQQAIRALVRAEALGKVEDKDGQPTLDLENERKVKAIHRKVAKLQLNLEEIEEEDKCEEWLKQQTKRFNLSAQKKLVEILLSRNVLLDCQRVTMPLDDEDIEGSLGQIYTEDVGQAVKLWQDTHGTNHVKIIRDIVHAYREKDGEIEPVAGLYKVATLAEIEENGWSLNPGRYVGVAEWEADDYEFAERLEELNEELEILNVEARELEERIAENVVMLLEGML